MGIKILTIFLLLQIGLTPWQIKLDIKGYEPVSVEASATARLMKIGVNCYIIYLLWRGGLICG